MVTNSIEPFLNITRDTFLRQYLSTHEWVSRYLSVITRNIRPASKVVYHLVFEITAIAFANPAFGLGVYWFLFWPLVLDWI